ncbi:hypothetical protein LZ554_004196 [Drepanopeziza brunnea f. sp. 'monogermtubi']|nr:hypothetical protein LZ554_004196 [Drepanopeziza brunnea f. sp. 'monogermtubi']
MSGRSAYVRKEKTRTKDASTPASEGEKQLPDKLLGVGDSQSSLPSSRQLSQHMPEVPFRSQNNEISTTQTNGSNGSDDLAYARVRKPHIPIIDISGIEKSSFRTAMDRKSEEARKGLSSLFRKKNKKGDDSVNRGSEHDYRPFTAGATSRPDSDELDSAAPSTMLKRARSQHLNDAGSTPPLIGEPPPVPPRGPQLNRWMGNGRPVKPWNKLRKDPELWDPNGDTLIFFGHEGQAQKGPPSFRLSSSVLEQTESRFLVSLLREGSIDDGNNFGMPPSPNSSPGMRQSLVIQEERPRHPTPPMSEGSICGPGGVPDGQISYEIFFPVPRDATITEILRHQVTTRNVFALLYQASLAGLNLYQALNDLHQRLELYMPDEMDAAGMLIDYVVSKGLDDVRNDPATAAALLAWSESSHVRWEEGWREAYVHSCGMYYRLENSPDFHNISPITRALLERASLDVHERVQSCEARFTDFDFGDMWPVMSSHPPPARAAFERLRKFFHQHYRAAYTQWPPAPREGLEQWLSRDLVQELQKDFGALYDYLVNREVVWDCVEERSGRKWNIVHPANRGFDADSQDLPFTDILVAFDNRNRFPHIPHPYPLVPESIPIRSDFKENFYRASKKSNKPAEDKMAERKAALAYTESTNIYLLGSDFVHNNLVEAFVRFEKSDCAGVIDPYAARRGRWVLIYGILQTLASISVDTPNLRYTSDVAYHLNPRLRGTPPWKGANQNMVEASHVGSHCWTVRDSWQPEVAAAGVRRLTLGTTSKRSSALSITSSDAGSLMRSASDSVSRISSVGRRSNGRRENNDTSYSGYAPDEWPIREESSRERARSRSRPNMEYAHRSAVGRKRHSIFPNPPSYTSEDRVEYTMRTREQKEPLPLPQTDQNYLIRDFDDDSFGGEL